VAGGRAITITGSGFRTGAVVEIGQGHGAAAPLLTATKVVVVSATKITAVTPGGAKAGTWNLFVVTAGGPSPAVTSDRYTYRRYHATTCPDQRRTDRWACAGRKLALSG
jgi:hypothetical protein